MQTPIEQSLRVSITSLSSVDPEIIGGFTVVTYSSNGSVVERISSPSAEDATENQYDILLYASMPVTTLEIKGSFGTSLSLCEVTVLGDYVCPDYRHGLSCKKHCYCEGHQLCSPISGKCVDGCPTGHYGFGCLGTCNSSCGTDPCLQNSGRCYLCPEGFRGENCNLECHAKTYGRSCEQKCSPNCRDQCDTINGACDCAMGYKHSPRCLACDEGTFGINCAQNCSMNCLDRKCDHVTGECLKCRDNKHGNFCEVCPSGKYGDNCSLNCSQFCVDRICDSVTGFCENCLRGRVGRLCTDCPLNHYGHSCNGTCPKNCESGLCNVTTGLCFSCSSNFIGPTCSSIGGLRSKLMYFSPLLLLTVIPCIVLLWQRNDGKRRRTTVMSSFAVSEEDIYQSDLIDRESV
ncbi:hypothetical protein BsWGS_25116 [Bradybaena similaris]